MKKIEKTTEAIKNIIEAARIPVNYIKYPVDKYKEFDMGLRSEILGFENEGTQMEYYYDSLEQGKIYFFSDIFHCNYAAILLPNEKNLFMCGPVLYEKLEGEQFEKLFSSFHLSDDFYERLRDYYSKIVYFPMQALFESMMKEYGKSLYKKSCEIVYMDLNDIEKYNVVYSNFFRIAEKPFSNIEVVEERYELENKIMDAVSAGNEIATMEMVNKILENANYYPRRIVDKLRDRKDYALTLNSLVCKVTEGAGIHPIYIDSVSNSFIKELESCVSIEQCNLILGKVMKAYCELVKEQNHEGKSRLIKKILTYIDTDLCTNLTLKSFAKLLNVNVCYLSALFSKEMGMSLTDYVNLCRINHAKKLLAGTNLPIKSIAEQCGYSGIHYFSRVFKNIAGITPKAYRKENSYTDKRELYGLEED